MGQINETVATYNRSAQQLSEYFAGIGPRIDDIETAIGLTRQIPETILAIEIGCGDGRDAVEIVKRVGEYEGFDPSEEMLDIAARRLPFVSFAEADAQSYDYPPDIDLYFAFASLLHVNRQDLAKVFEKVSASLKPGGILYMSLKERPDYDEEMLEDQAGNRMFYYYNPALIKKIAGSAFRSVFESHQIRGKTKWFTMALKNQ